MTVLSPAQVTLHEERAELLYQRLIRAARCLGYVVEEDFLDQGCLSVRTASERRITVEAGASVPQQAAALAHQLGHAMRSEVER